MLQLDIRMLQAVRLWPWGTHVLLSKGASRTISHPTASNLLSRAADVTLKEGRRFAARVKSVRMSRRVGREFRAEVVTGLARSGEARDQALILATVDSGLYPRPRCLAPLRSPRSMLTGSSWLCGRLATARRISSAQVGAALFWIGNGTAYNILLSRDESVPFAVEGRPLIAISAWVDEVRADDVGYATLTNPITFEPANPTEVLPRWEDLSDCLAVLSVERRAPIRHNEE